MNYRSHALLYLLALAGFPNGAIGQTVEDAVMLPSKTLFSGFLYSHDSWNRYWEGTLNRANGNLGKVTTQTSTVFANYGITDKLNVIGTVPYVWTHTSQGVLAGQGGWQDLMLAAKYKIAEILTGDAGSFRILGAGYWGRPLMDYTPDFQPLSMGL